MKYNIEDLKQEFETWISRTFDDLENVLDREDGTTYERPDIDVDSLPLFTKYVPMYLGLVREGEWKNDNGMESEIEPIAVIAESSSHVNADPYFTHLYKSAEARIKLFQGSENLTISEIALLAQVDERTVRNAASTGKKLLKTVKVGSSTMIKPKDANQWLSGRRGFQPTVILDVLSTKALRNVHEELYSIANDQNLKLDEILSDCGFEKNRIKKLTKSDSLDLDLNGMELINLADYLGLSKFYFVEIIVENSNRNIL